MNPCPCGFQGHPNGKCRCTPDQVARYRSRISGPLLDRIDLQLEVPAVDGEELQGPAHGEPSATIRERVAAALDRQLSRQGKVNARLSAAEVDRHCPTDDPARTLLAKAMARLDLSARAYHRILKVARTVADLAASSAIHRPHVAEAIQYRRLASD